MTDIRDLKFSIRTRNLLLNAGVETVEDLLESDLDKLRREHMFGPVTMAEIDRKIREHTQRGVVEDEDRELAEAVLRGLKPLGEEGFEITRIARGLTVITPSGRHVVIRIDG